MRIDIKPHWQKLAKWYWNTLEGKTMYNSGMSIWDMLENEYGVQRGFNGQVDGSMYAVFPDEKSYIMFLLKWA